MSENDKHLIDEFKSVSHISQTSMPYHLTVADILTPAKPLSDTSIPIIKEQPTPNT